MFIAGFSSLNQTRHDLNFTEPRLSLLTTSNHPMGQLCSVSVTVRSASTLLDILADRCEKLCFLLVNVIRSGLVIHFEGKVWQFTPAIARSKLVILRFKRPNERYM